MEAIYKQEYFLSAGDANAEGELSLTTLVTKIIEIATDHANSLGIGNPSMAHMNAGWILSRLTVGMNRYPKVNSNYCLSTWIEDFNRHFSTRCFKIESSEGEVLGYARSIWLVMDAVNHTALNLSHLNVPDSLIPGEGVPLPRQEKHIPVLPEEIGNETGRAYISSDYPPFEYRFKYCDLDFYRHVNTIRYVAMLLNQFSLEDHDSTFVSRMELSFLHEASFGMDTLLFRADAKENRLSSSFQLSKAADLSPLLFARVVRNLRPGN